MKRNRLRNEDTIITSGEFTSIYKYWSDGSYRSKLLYNKKGKLINVFNYTYYEDRSVSHVY